jgi:MFS family permease
VFALALPLNVAGLFLLRLVQDLARIGYEKEVTEAFQEVGFTAGVQVPTPESLEAQRKRRTRIVLYSSLGILALSAILTLTGLTSTLWHMAWWEGVAFLAMVIISLGIVIVVIVASQPPESAEEKEQKRRYREEIIRKTKAQYKKKY